MQGGCTAPEGRLGGGGAAEQARAGQLLVPDNNIVVRLRMSITPSLISFPDPQVTCCSPLPPRAG